MMNTAMYLYRNFLRGRRAIAMVAFAVVAGGCAVGPDYQRPTAAVPSAYKEAGNWVSAAPADALDRGAWWKLFNDPVLDDLAARVDVSNQNIAAAVAAYAQARALVGEQRAGLFPTVSLNGSANRSGGSGSAAANAGSATPNAAAGSDVRNSYRVSIGGTWEPDIWGKLRRTVEGASASAQASAADLAAARLSAQGELAINYFSLRQTDTQKALLDDTVAAYQRSLQIAQNRYAAGIATKTDVLQAQTQYANAQADATGLARQRAQFEHAIAVLTGKAPGDFTLTPTAWSVTVPDVPVGMPSTLLERRPDIASAERRVAAANEQIGIAQSAWFPSFSLSASDASAASRVADLFKSSSNVWALGLTAAETLFDAGATGSRVDSARAAHEAAVAHYRQTVLAAFQDVENQLTAIRVLAQQQELRRQASQAADEAEQRMLNRYRAGQVDYSQVVTAQATALSARRALVQVQADRQTAAVALIQALGGGWQAR
jgi:NodT family efflux transporter outer membrane factor (OMF) lipoprotein